MAGISSRVADTKGEAFVKVHENAILALAAALALALAAARLAEPDTDA